jgi:hypothetical protein
MRKTHWHRPARITGIDIEVPVFDHARGRRTNPEVGMGVGIKTA